MDKKEQAKARDDLALHVLLAMREGMTKAKAQAVAYSEGKVGLDRRLGQSSLPFGDKPKSA